MSRIGYPYLFLAFAGMLLPSSLPGATLWPRERFMGPLKKLESVLSRDLSDEAMVKACLKEGRGIAYGLEGLSRLYANYPGAKQTFEKLIETFKTFEDTLSNYDYELSRAVESKKLGAPASVIDHYKKKAADELEKVIAFLTDEEWIHKKNRGAIDKAREEITSVDWQPYARDRAYVLGQIAAHAEKIHRDLIKGGYDLTLLEEGIHELRRDIRWITIYSKGLNGLVLLGAQNCPVTEYQALSGDAFTNLDGPEKSTSSCRLTPCLYFAVSRQIKVLGQVKDVGQRHEFLKKGLEKQEGLSPEVAETQAWSLARKSEDYKSLRKQFPDLTELIPMAQRLAEEMRRTRLLPRLASELETCEKD